MIFGSGRLLSCVDDKPGIHPHFIRIIEYHGFLPNMQYPIRQMAGVMKVKDKRRGQFWSIALGR
jgi:hypothetical protein